MYVGPRCPVSRDTASNDVINPRRLTAATERRRHTLSAFPSLRPDGRLLQNSPTGVTGALSARDSHGVRQTGLPGGHRWQGHAWGTLWGTPVLTQPWGVHSFARCFRTYTAALRPPMMAEGDRRAPVRSRTLVTAEV